MPYRVITKVPLAAGAYRLPVAQGKELHSRGEREMMLASGRWKSTKKSRDKIATFRLR